MRNQLYIVCFGIVSAALFKLFGFFLLPILYLLWIFTLFWLKRIQVFMFVFVVILPIFFYNYFPDLEKIRAFDLGNQTQFSGKISSDIQIEERRISFDFLESLLEGKLRIVYYPGPEEDIVTLENTLKTGATCEFTGEVNEQVYATNPGQFNYRDYLHKMALNGEVVLDAESLQCSGHSILDYFYTVRSKTLVHINERFPEHTARWMQALLFGEQSALEKTEIELFQRWELAHVLAISGLHIGILIGVIYFLLVRTNFITREAAWNILLIILPIYLFAAGGAASVWRAISTALLGIGLQIFRIHVSLLDLFSLVFISLLLLNPFYIYQVGFQFSFLVTFGILLSRRWFSQSESRLFQALKLSVISQLMIIPLQLIYFYEIQPLGILLNLLIVPYISLFSLPILLLLFFISLFPFIQVQVFSNIFSWCNEHVLDFIQWIDQQLSAPIVTGEFSVVLICLYYSSLFIMLFAAEIKRKWLAFGFGCLLTLILIYPTIAPYFSKTGMITMLDVGQGDVLVIELPQRRGVILYDVGATFSFQDMEPSRKVYESVIRPYLEYRGIKQIDAIFLSHEDLDHDGSLPFILEDYRVDQIIVSSLYKPRAEMLESWEHHGSTVLSATIGTDISIKGQRFKVIGPLAKTDSANENSLILQSTFGGASWLFTGDMGKPTEALIKTAWPELEIDILRVGHHGSRHSTEADFIQYFRPSYGLISVGRNNRYGHPAPEVLDVLIESEVRVLRTDLEGAIQFIYTDKGGYFQTFLP